VVLLLLLLLLPQDVDVVRQLEAGRIEVDLKPSTNFNNGAQQNLNLGCSTPLLLT
jgi:hypothetical protein